MSIVRWESGLSVGVIAMDDEHRGLVGLINDLYDAMRLCSGAGVVGRILDGLATYTERHFSHEERLMAAHDYPELAAHVAEHLELTRRVHRLREKLAREGADACLTSEVLSFLTSWLVTHIHGSDKRYGPFLNARGVR